MAKLSNILELSVKIDFEVVLLDMVDFSLQNRILHTKYMAYDKFQQNDRVIIQNRRE